MPAQWLSSSSDIQARVGAAVDGALRGLAQPARARRLRQALMALFALWAVLALSRLIWGLFPSPETTAAADIEVLNPVSAQTASAGTVQVDIEKMVAWHLFGKAGEAQPEQVVPPAQVTEQNDRDGIEQGARETKLDLQLRGVVASTEDGLGHAIIEHRKRQAVYTVDDKLPVSGRVILAKVMPRQVVLDNGGKYELLTLYDDSGLDAQLPAQKAAPRPAPRAAPPPAASQDPGAGEQASAVASNYRDQLYQNPQSLAEVVNVSAVRDNGQLLGYRIGPGKNPLQFEQLGFKAGDLVTGINGIALNDPANTMRLYQTMRTATEAVFELQRGGRDISVSVRLDDGSTE